MKPFPIDPGILLLHNVEQLLPSMGKPIYDEENDEVSEINRSAVAVSKEMQKLQITNTIL